MYDDLNKLIDIKNEDIYVDKICFIETNYYDEKNYPDANNEYYNYELEI